MADDGRLEILKEEMNRAISHLSRANEFGIVAFSNNTVAWNTTPVRAHEPNKASAIAWVNGLVANGWTCLESAGVQTVQIANLSSKPERRIIVISDGEPICDGTDTSQACLTNITAANVLNLRIDTIYIGSGPGLGFMQQLARMNGGVARQVQ